MQVDPFIPTLKAPGTKRLKLKHDEPRSDFIFKFNLRRYTTKEAAAQAIDNYVKDCGYPERQRDRVSPFKGVFWHKHEGKWVASCKGKFLGNHATAVGRCRLNR